MPGVRVQQAKQKKTLSVPQEAKARMEMREWMTPPVQQMVSVGQTQRLPLSFPFLQTMSVEQAELAASLARLAPVEQEQMALWLLQLFLPAYQVPSHLRNENRTCEISCVFKALDVVFINSDWAFSLRIRPPSRRIYRSTLAQALFLFSSHQFVRFF
jgi:hypothetical protein